MLALRSDVEKEPLLRACGTSEDRLLKSIACPNRKGERVTRDNGGWLISTHKDAQYLCLNFLLGLLASYPKQPLNGLSQTPSHQLLTELLSGIHGVPCGSAESCIAGRGCCRQLHPCGALPMRPPLPCPLWAPATHCRTHQPLGVGSTAQQAHLARGAGLGVVPKFSQFEVGRFVALGRRAGRRGLGRVAGAGLGVGQGTLLARGERDTWGAGAREGPCRFHRGHLAGAHKATSLTWSCLDVRERRDLGKQEGLESILATVGQPASQAASSGQGKLRALITVLSRASLRSNDKAENWPFLDRMPL